MFNLNRIEKVINNKKKYFDLKIIFFLNLINSILELFSILSLPIFISLLIDQNYLIEKYNIKIFFYFNNYEPITIMSILVILIFLAKNIFFIYLIYKQSYLINEIKIEISKKIFSIYLLGSYLNHLSKNPSTLTRDATHSVQSFGFYIFHLINLFREIVAITFLILLLFIVKPFIILISLFFFLLIIFIFQKSFKNLLKKKSKENETINQLFIKNVYNTFLSIKDIKILKKEADIVEMFKSDVTKFENNLRFFQVIEKIPKSILEILTILFLLVISIFLFKVSNNQIEFFTIVSLFLVATIRLLPSFTSTMTSINYLKIFEPGVITLYSEYKRSAKTSVSYNKDFRKFYTPKPNPEKLIIVDGLKFNYDKNKHLLKDINLEIVIGKMNCITGETGSGKSTIFNLMLGLLEPQRGNIYYKNKNILLDISNWHREISLVSQDPYLFEDSIIKNITFNILEDQVDKKRLNKAIEISELNSTIAKLEKGLKTKVSTQSINLSGGEKQRIALARAIYKDSSVFFLDEFTNAIDNATEIKILQNLKQLKDKTFIIISHKKETINKCEKIFKLQNGKII